MLIYQGFKTKRSLTLSPKRTLTLELANVLKYNAIERYLTLSNAGLDINAERLCQRLKALGSVIQKCQNVIHVA